MHADVLVRRMDTLRCIVPVSTVGALCCQRSKLTTWSAWLTQVVAVGSAACMLLRICCTAGQARPRTLPVRGTVRLPSDTCRVHPVCQPGRCLSKLANGCHVRAGFLSQALTRKTNHVRMALARPAGS